jgi:hypothetical protein
MAGKSLVRGTQLLYFAGKSSPQFNQSLAFLYSSRWWLEAGRGATALVQWGSSVLLASLMCLCGAVFNWLLSTVAWCLGSLLRGVRLLGPVPWTSHTTSAAAPVSLSTSRCAGPDVDDGFGFLGQNFVFAELTFPRRQSTCCELTVFSLYLLFNFM